MPARREYTDADRDVLLSFVDASNGDVRKAARRANIPERIAKYWASGGGIDPLEIALEASGGEHARPMPPETLIDPNYPIDDFVVDPAVSAWMMATFILDGAPLENPDHAHLSLAKIGVYWTNVAKVRQGRRTGAQVRIPDPTGDEWAVGLQELQLRKTFGEKPNFIITIDAVLASEMNNASFCAMIEHELYHCAQRMDQYGSPKFDREGNPVYTIRKHDVEEFVPVRRRYGLAACAAGMVEMEALAGRPAELTTDKIDFACGTCLASLA